MRSWELRIASVVGGYGKHNITWVWERVGGSGVNWADKKLGNAAGTTDGFIHYDIY